MAKFALFGLAPLLFAGAALGQALNPTAAASPQLVFREPFTLRLHVDKDHYYEERIDRKFPYVADGDVYLFSGESFGINIISNDDSIVSIRYQPDLKSADVTFEFKQVIGKGGEGMMLLKTPSNIDRILLMDALMTVPGSKKVRRTSILPLKARLVGYESWPHSIYQLVLRKFRFENASVASPNPVPPETSPPSPR